VSFAIEEGSVCALVGKSGGGKSTLVHLLLRYYDPTAGRLTLGGVDYTQLSLSSLHAHTGVVSQETQLFNTTIAENIGYGAPPHSHEAMLAAAAAAQAHDFISSFEDGYETRVGERGQRLSGGQKQRIAIARCLLRRPRLLLLDEATSALDAESEALVQKALDELIWAGGHTVVLVAHRLSTVVNAHQSPLWSTHTRSWSWTTARWWSRAHTRRCCGGRVCTPPSWRRSCRSSASRSRRMPPPPAPSSAAEPPRCLSQQ